MRTLYEVCKLIEGYYDIAWPDYFDLVAEVEWTQPVPHDLLFSGGVDADETAYFYSIIAYLNKQWWPYYIGMVFDQYASVRNQQKDHRDRLAKLQNRHPGVTFSITLGTPFFRAGRLTRDSVSAIEGILIYGHWHDGMINERRINRFSHAKQIFVRNIGWHEHVESEIAYGVFYR